MFHWSNGRCFSWHTPRLDLEIWAGRSDRDTVVNELLLGCPSFRLSLKTSQHTICCRPFFWASLTGVWENNACNTNLNIHSSRIAASVIVTTFSTASLHAPNLHSSTHACNLKLQYYTILRNFKNVPNTPSQNRSIWAQVSNSRDT